MLLSHLANKLMIMMMKNNPAKFHPDPIGNDGALEFFEVAAPTRRTR